MKARALIMAGGAGLRMLASHGPTPKPLVPVLGVPLLERNLQALVRCGFLSVAVALPAAGEQLRAYCRRRLEPLLRSLGGELRLVGESVPLGTVGAAALLEADEILVVNADNLTTLDLSAMLQDHRSAGAALTLAVHEQPFQLDFGQIEESGGWITAYREKPVHRFPVASAVSVLGASALRELVPGMACGLPQLTRRLLERGLPVRAHRHAEPWIDVNDRRAVERAEELIRGRPEGFELWAPSVYRQVVGAVLRRPDGAMLLERRSASAELSPGLWDTPGGKVEPTEDPARALQRELREELGLEAAPGEPAAAFDELDPACGRILRHHVFTVAASVAKVRPRQGQTLGWFSAEELAHLDDASPVVRRSLAACPAEPPPAAILEAPRAGL